MKYETIDLFSAGFDFGTDSSAPAVSAGSFSVSSSPEPGKLTDFGSKIGGARKDLWRTRGLTVADVSVMTEVEKDTLVKKDNIWIKPDYKSLVQNDGLSKGVVYFMKTMRDALAPAPELPLAWDTDEKNDLRNRYVTLVSSLRDSVMACRNMNDVAALAEWPVDHGYVPTMSRWCVAVTQKGTGLFTAKLLSAFPSSDAENCSRLYNSKAVQKKFCFTERELTLSNFHILPFGNGVTFSGKSFGVKHAFGTSFFYPNEEKTEAKYLDPDAYEDGKWFVFSLADRKIVGINFESKDEAEEAALKYSDGVPAVCDVPRKTSRKSSLKYNPLSSVVSSGFDYRNGKEATSDMYLNELRFRAGEFGNWLNEKERQQNLSFAYDSFMNIAEALDLDPAQVTFNGELAIAFGARGRGRALAHYEPGRVVINLTKMKGAGSLGHEWCHFFDDMLNRKMNGSMARASFMSEAPTYQRLNSFNDLMRAIKSKKLSHEESVNYVSAELAEKAKAVYEEAAAYLARTSLSDAESETARNLILSSIDEFEKTEMFNDSPAFESLKAFCHERKMYPSMLSWMKYRRRSLRTAYERVERMKADPESTLVIDTDFYKSAKSIDALYSRSGFGYWASDVELVARAGACWLKDKLNEKGIRDDYLNGHAEAFMMSSKDGIIRSYPVGEERRIINEAFDAVLAEAKKEQMI